MADSHLPALPSNVPTFTPVPIRTRAGWTAGKQGLFIETLTATGSVRLSTVACGMSESSVYKLRHMPGGTSFGEAWDEAVTIAARRVRDVLVDHSIYGVPERVLIGRDTVIERRRFNHRSMIWVLQHHMADQYPGGSTTQRRGWKGGPGGTATSNARGGRRPMSADELRAVIMEKLGDSRKALLRQYAADPERRRAFELLNGPVDWAAIENGGSEGPNEENGAQGGEER